MENIQNLLSHHQIKPSYTRMVIFRYLRDNHTHPTVDEIYQALAEELPTLSKTTVYNTLKLFIDHHLVREINLKEQKRYDVVTTPHAHFKCDRCDELYDVEIAPPSLDEKSSELFVVRDVQLLYHGVCRKCQKTT